MISCFLCGIILYIVNCWSVCLYHEIHSGTTVKLTLNRPCRSTSVKSTLWEARCQSLLNWSRSESSLIVIYVLMSMSERSSRHAITTFALYFMCAMCCRGAHPVQDGALDIQDTARIVSAIPGRSATTSTTNKIAAVLRRSALLVTVPRTQTALATRAFSVAAPTVWNGLPSNVRSCDSLLTFRRQTHYFTAAYA